MRFELTTCCLASNRSNQLSYYSGVDNQGIEPWTFAL